MIQSLRVSILNTYELKQLKTYESRDPTPLKLNESVFEDSLRLIDQGDEVDFPRAKQLPESIFEYVECICFFRSSDYNRFIRNSYWFNYNSKWD